MGHADPMRMYLFAFLCLATPAWSDACHDLWFTRNLVIDRAGYCFGSALGQAVFDNSDCVGTSVKLAPETSKFVATLQRLEKNYECRVNTKQTELLLDDAWVRLQLDHLPIADEFESACIGYRGAPRSVRSGHAEGYPVIGSINAGDTISFGHLPQSGWAYVTYSGPDWSVKGGGWINSNVTLAECNQWAG